MDRFNKGLIKRGIEVSFLGDLVLEKQEYHRTYFQVSLGQMKTIEEKLDFIEENFDKWDTEYELSVEGNITYSIEDKNERNNVNMYERYGTYIIDYDTDIGIGSLW